MAPQRAKAELADMTGEKENAATPLDNGRANITRSTRAPSRISVQASPSRASYPVELAAGNRPPTGSTTPIAPSCLAPRRKALASLKTGSNQPAAWAKGVEISRPAICRSTLMQDSRWP